MVELHRSKGLTTRNPLCRPIRLDNDLLSCAWKLLFPRLQDVNSFVFPILESVTASAVFLAERDNV